MNEFFDINTTNPTHKISYDEFIEMIDGHSKQRLALVKLYFFTFLSVFLVILSTLTTIYICCDMGWKDTNALLISGILALCITPFLIGSCVITHKQNKYLNKRNCKYFKWDIVTIIATVVYYLTFVCCFLVHFFVV